MAGTVPAHALYFAGYEMSKKTLQPSIYSFEISLFKTVRLKRSLLGCILFLEFGLMCVVQLFGFQWMWSSRDYRLKRHLVHRVGIGIDSKDGKYKGSAQALLTIWKEEGTRGLFKVPFVTRNQL